MITFLYQLVLLIALIDWLVGLFEYFIFLFVEELLLESILSIWYEYKSTLPSYASFYIWSMSFVLFSMIPSNLSIPSSSISLKFYFYIFVIILQSSPRDVRCTLPSSNQCVRTWWVCWPWVIEVSSWNPYASARVGLSATEWLRSRCWVG
jgi:hypothetical protein